jgi:hypothetical protein
VSDYPDSLVQVVWYQPPNHPELQSRAGEARAVRYNVAGLWPSAYFDGFYRVEQVPEIDSFYSAFVRWIPQAQSLGSALVLSLDSTSTGMDSTQISIGVHITPTDSAVNAMSTLMLAAVIYEDSVPYVNALNGETLYARFCARSVIGDTWGVPLALKFGRDFDTVLTAPLGTGNPAHLGAAVFVQDTSNLRVLWSASRRHF